MRKRLIGVLLLVAISFAGMGYVSETFAAEAKPYEGTTLRVAAILGPPVESWMSVAEGFAAEMGIKLELMTYTMDDLMKKILLDAKAEVSTWDIVYFHGTMAAPWIKAGAVTPIGTYVNDPAIADPQLNVDDFLWVDRFCVSDGFWGPEGVLWSFPHAYGLPILFYRKDLFEDPAEKEAFKQKYGYELRIPETYDEFYDVAQFFTRKKGETLAGKVLEYDFYGTSHSCKTGTFLWHDYFDYMAAWGALPIYDPITMMPRWNSPENIAAAKYFTSLKPFMPPGAEAMGSGEATAVFVQGKVAMIKEFQVRVFQLAEDTETSKIIGKWAFTANPSVPGTGIHSAILVNMDSMAIYAFSKHKEAAYKLLEKVDSLEGQRERIRVGSFWSPVTRKSVPDDPEIEAMMPWYLERRAEILTECEAYTHPRLAELDSIMEITMRYFSQAFAGAKTVEQAFNEAQEELVDLFKRVGYLK